MKKVKLSEKSICRFSDLPESIVHEIMSFLPFKDATRASTVSKNFTSAWNSIPVLDVDSSSFLTCHRHSYRYRYHPHDFDEFTSPSPFDESSSDEPLEILPSLLRRRAANASLRKFRISLDESLDSIADNVIVLAIEIGVIELSLNFSSKNEFHYTVPIAVFSAHSLKLLDLTGFRVNQSNLVLECPLLEELRCHDSSGFVEIQVLSPILRKAEFVTCKGLRRIEIKSWILESFNQIQNTEESCVNNTEESCVIEIAASESVKAIALEGSSITDFSKFIVLESLKLKDCTVIAYVHVSSDGLKLVEVRGCNSLKRIVIESQSLETFEYEINGKERRECEISLLHCRSLKKLVLVGASVTDSWLIDHMGRLISLESLTLRECNFLKNLEIYDHETLKSLVLESCSVELEVDCRAQNLAVFRYEGELIASPPFVIARDLHAKFSLKFPPNDTHYEDNPATSPLYGPFKKLRDFLVCYGHCKTVTLAVDQAFIFPAEVREEIVPPFYGMNNLKLQFSWDSMPVVELVDTALWLAPRLHILALAHEYGDTLIKFGYGKTLTMGAEEEEAGRGSCCFQLPIKCWRHKVTKVAIEKWKCVDEETCKRLIHYFFIRAKTLEEILVDGHSYTRKSVVMKLQSFKANSTNWIVMKSSAEQ